jgi:hypothetical protein
VKILKLELQKFQRLEILLRLPVNLFLLTKLKLPILTPPLTNP